ncbi:MAG: imidazole glycerol phosphate synthase subunit HisH [Actinomycetota bacterium]|nr:imidazole glycerol phosphate synthase subunit HisH [Actinomycetota bacterium]
MIAVLDYGIGNLRSAQKALEKVGGDAVLVTDAAAARGARGVVLPGVGAFGPCMEALRASGLDAVAVDAVAEGTPFLGVCVGMQLLYVGSEESPAVAGLGVLQGSVRALPEGVKRPQMQWNVLEPVRHSALLSGLPQPPWAYFVHSFAPEMTEEVVATCEYGGPVVAAVERGNLWATQFHPEKSGVFGLGLLRNFVERCSAEGTAPGGAGAPATVPG